MQGCRRTPRCSVLEVYTKALYFHMSTKHRIASKYLRFTKGDNDIGNKPKNSLTTGVLDADDEQMLLVNVAGHSRILGLNKSWVEGSQNLVEVV